MWRMIAQCFSWSEEPYFVAKKWIQSVTVLSNVHNIAQCRSKQGHWRHAESLHHGRTSYKYFKTISFTKNIFFQPLIKIYVLTNKHVCVFE